MLADVSKLIKEFGLPFSNRENLNEKDESNLQVLLDYSEEFRLAYALQEWFRYWYQVNTYEIARSQLYEWYEATDTSGITESASGKDF